MKRLNDLRERDHREKREQNTDTGFQRNQKPSGNYTIFMLHLKLLLLHHQLLQQMTGHKARVTSEIGIQPKKVSIYETF